MTPLEAGAKAWRAERQRAFAKRGITISSWDEMPPDIQAEEIAAFRAGLEALPHDALLGAIDTATDKSTGPRTIDVAAFREALLEDGRC